MISIHEDFKTVYEELKKQQVLTNTVSGKRQSASSSNLEKMSLENWSKEQFENIKQMTNEKEISLLFRYSEFVDYLTEDLSEQLRNVLNSFMNSGFHTDMVPCVDRIDLDGPFALNNLQVLTWEEKRNRWNQFLAKNRISFNFTKTPVRQIELETGKVLNVFPSISEAKKFLGVTGHDDRLRECCEGKRDQVYGFRWEFHLKNSEESVLF